MAIVRLTKEFFFEMAHKLGGYNGACRNVHGHSYRLGVTVIGQPNSDKSSPYYGMVMDFNQLKRIVTERVISRFDHALLLNSDSDCSVEDELKGLSGVVLVPYQPTCENMLLDIANLVKPELPEGVELHHLTLDETHSSKAEWYASDNS